ncbi:unnamed protein product [Hymenolepis diminuta]|uniref:PPIase cyclophilin-type domain-containing protein n=1 Tax=Hymenolepis diminuta TaxID=6216 RepID=A0A0R3SK87_HYMDI|nr:unnamed protein product [Hymenolepis diminuta]
MIQSTEYTRENGIGSNKNCSQIFVTLVKTVWLDCEYVLFCKVVEAIGLVQEMGNVGTQS